LATCDGEIYYTPGGLIGIRGGKWEEPTVTITDDHIRSYVYERQGDKLAAFNRLKITYTSPDHQYQIVEADPLDDLANQNLTGEVLTEDLDLSMVQSSSQASRLAKIAMAKGNPAHRLQLVTNGAGLDVLGQRIIRVQLADLGIDTTFLVVGYEPSADLTSCSMTLTSLDASAYAWSSSEERSPPPVPQNTVSAITVEQPANLIVIQEGSPTKIRLRAATPSNTTLTFRGQYKVSTDPDSAYLDMVSDPADPWAVVSGSVTDGVTYSVIGRFEAPFGAVLSAWTSPINIKITSNTAAPAATSAVTASKAGTTVNLSWTNPASTNFHGARIYRNTTNNYGTSVRINTVHGLPSAAATYADTSRPNGTYYYWVAPINTFGTFGPETASTPTSITIP
jgi:hypothetical protein